MRVEKIRKSLNDLARANNLTLSERQVLLNIAKGESVQTVANRTGKSIKTISTQKRNAYKKMGVKNDVLFIYHLFDI
ncbi:response regulator transcription factor [Salmonella enterica subsp. enterica]|nr:response regulator transcription factor [Salmonella enterica subsp. enterica]